MYLFLGNTWIKAIIVICLISVGCQDGPMFTLKSANPYYRKQWDEDAKKGPVFYDRQEEIRLVRKQLPTMDAAEQERWTKIIADIYQYDKSPELRREAVLALGQSPTPLADETLVKACSDSIDKVRIAACSSLANRESTTAPQMLATLAQTDKNMSVRLAAIKSLGSYKSDDAKSILRKSLDEKSPALQYEATLALQDMTGKKYGGDVDAWRKFMDGESVPEPVPTIAETITSSIGIRR